MNPETRNTRVVICLILAMTAGARFLLWLEPSTAPAGRASALVAAGGMPVADILIEYAPPHEDPSVNVDCLVLPDGRCVWSPRSPHVRLVVQGSGSERDGLPSVQKQGLLAALASMLYGRDTQQVPLSLAPASDVRRNPSLPRQARDLHDLLVSKGFIQ